jgi:hypothetical protein
MHTQTLERGAAIGTPLATRPTLTAIHIGFDRTTVSNFDPLDAFAQLVDDDTQLVAEYPGIAEKGLSSAKGAHIGAADSNAVDPNDHLAMHRRTRWFRLN